MLAGRIDAFYGNSPKVKEIAPDGIFSELARLHYDTANAVRENLRGRFAFSTPNRSTKSPERKREQKRRWFRNGQKWRTGCEGRIGVVKRRHGFVNPCMVVPAERQVGVMGRPPISGLPIKMGSPPAMPRVGRLLGLSRPMPSADPPHVQVGGDWQGIGEQLRAKRLGITSAIAD
jgi:hypothetical protein